MALKGYCDEREKLSNNNSNKKNMSMTQALFFLLNKILKL